MATKDRVTTVLSWQAPEFYYYPKTASWYVGLVLIAGAIGGVLWWAGILDWTNGLLIFVGLIVLIWFASRPPRTIQIRIEETGVIVGQTNLTYDQLTGWHLTDHRNYLTLDLQTKGQVLPVSAVITGVDPEMVRQTIGRLLPEKTSGNNYIADLMSRWLRF